MKIKNAFALATPPTNANGLDVFAYNANKKLVDCLDWLEYSFPLSYRRKELRGEALNSYYSPMCYLKSREWFRLEPDDTVKAFSFFYANSTRTSLTSSAYTQTLNFVVFANTERIFSEDNIYTETLINQALSVFRDSYFFDTIPLTNTLTVFEDFDDAWQDFDFPEVNKQRFLKENYSTFRIQFDVVYNVLDCLSCLEPVPPTPTPPDPLKDYYLNLSSVSRDVLKAENDTKFLFPSQGSWHLETVISKNTYEGFGWDLIGKNTRSQFVTEWSLQQKFENELRFIIGNSSGDAAGTDNRAEFVDFDFPFDGDFHMIRVEVDEFNLIKVFVDGEQKGSKQVPERPPNTGGLNFTIGGSTAIGNIEARYSNLSIKSLDINGEVFTFNEGAGFVTTSENGSNLIGETSSPDALNYWNENVWQEI